MIKLESLLDELDDELDGLDIARDNYCVIDFFARKRFFVLLIMSPISVFFSITLFTPY